MNKKCLWILGLLLIFSVSISAQRQIVLKGKVIDRDGKPIAMAIVAVENSSFGTYTNEFGIYELKLSSEKVFVVISALGYITQRYPIGRNHNQTLDIILEEQPFSLDAIEITAKGKTQQLKEGSFTVNALDIAPLANRITNLNAVVNRTTGVKVREDGGVGSDFELSINGLSGNSVRYFIDGMPLSMKGTSASLANLPVSSIERVEIYKGVVPASLGADALGGAVNIITRQNRKSYLDASYGIGSFHTHKADLNGQYITAHGLIIKPAFSINYSKNDYLMKGVELWDETDRVFKQVNKKRFHDAYFNIQAQLELGVTDRWWTDAFFIQTSYSSTNKELQTGAIQNIIYGKARREQDAMNLSLQYRKKKFINDHLDLTASASYTWDHSLTIDTAYRKYWWDGSYIESSRNEITGRARSQRHYKRPLTLIRTNLNYTLSEKHSFNLNYLLNRTGNKRYDDIDTDFESSNDILAKHILGFSYNQSFFADRWQNSFFVKDYINYLKVEQQDLSWITGALDAVGSSTKNHIGYGVGSRYNCFPSLSLKLSFEHSVRLPLARELLGNGTTVYPNLRLKPENSNNYNAGLFGSYPIARNHILYYEASVFYRNVKDYIHTVISEAEGMSQYDNVSKVDVKGVEGEIRYSYSSKLDITANCSYQDARSKTKYYADGSPMITYNNKIPNRPWLFGNLSVQYNQPGWPVKNGTFRAGYNYEYVHWFYLTWEGYGNLESKSRIPTQHLHHLFIGQSFHEDRYNISVECSNLFDRKVYDNFMLQKPGRSFFCKFRILIN